MPVRHWSTLPETEVIDEMLRAAPERVQKMIELSEGFAQSAREYFPATGEATTLESLAAAASQCRACDLHCHATQVVFGRGPQSARIVIVGEQPGDQEDLAGQPFIGPAGEVLNQALQAAGSIVRNCMSPTSSSISSLNDRANVACTSGPTRARFALVRPWFEAEWSALQASILVCLGATPATALINPGFRIQQQRGQWLASRYCDNTLATWHPSSILRLPDKKLQTARFEELVSDLIKVRTLLG